MSDRASRVFVLGIDGVPYSLIERFVDAGVMTRLGQVIRHGSAVQYDSILPTVSNVAWAAFQTGKGPGGFDVFGFAEVDERMRLRLPNAADLKSDTLAELVGRAGGRVVSLGVPCTYPPRPINGLLVSGFLAPRLEKAVYPPARLPRLQELGYQLDIDPAKAREDLGLFKRQLLAVFDGRRRTVQALLDEETWDLFVVHVMETDRINHFLWRQWEAGTGSDALFFEDFYRRLDDLIGWLDAHLDERDVLIVMSDHGFCGVHREVELNRWLKRKGYLSVAGDPGEMFGAVSADSAAFALVPGRIHILRNDVYDRGRVTAGKYESVRAKLMAELAGLTDPGTGRSVCRRVLKREEVFAGPYASHGPDIVVEPHWGYDLKANLVGDEVFSQSPINGMHTYEDAFLCVRGRRLTGQRRCVVDVTRSVLEILGVPVPPGLDSRGVLDGE